jgi:hypothetical protein
VLKDPALTKIYVTMIPEELPVTEGLELARDVQAELEQQPVLLLNRWLECPLTVGQIGKFSGHDFADYLSTLLQRQAHLKATAEGRGLPLKFLPWLFADGVPEKIRALAKEFA